MDKYTNEISIHSGHRRRLREKVKISGLKSLSEHEVVELLLNYSIPRQNTNPLAHNLINNFGSLAKVIDADYYDLLKVKGMGEESALFFNVLSNLIKEYKISKAKDENVIIRTTMDGVTYFRKHLAVEEKEILHIICMSKLGKIISAFTFDGDSDMNLNFDFKMFVDKVNRDNVFSVMMFHTHPAGKAEPSLKDLQTTQRCVYICHMLGINFLDHIVLNETDFCSMHQCGFIERMKANSAKLISSPLEEVDDKMYSVKELFAKSINSINFDNIDLGDISIEEKFKRKY